MIKSLLIKLLPERLLNLYHFIIANIAAFIYGHPSERLIVIGVTGTNGKSSTVNYIGQLLEHTGHRVGWTSTASFKVGPRQWINNQKMTMLGRFQTQKFLCRMVDDGCTHAIIETSSQGIVQSRHVGINYDVVVFTNLTPEHLEAHKGFENYKRAKGDLFIHTAHSPEKVFSGKIMEKKAVVNFDDEHASFFLSLGIKKQFAFGVEGRGRKEFTLTDHWETVLVKQLETTSAGSTFRIDGFDFNFQPLGLFNVYNALCAITTLRALDIPWLTIRDAVQILQPVPGRMERIDAGQPFSVFVDYAYEPVALSALYEALALLGQGRIIHVLGSAGGGRDISRRPLLGEMAAKHDDIVIVTNEDPYDDDPREIIDQVAQGALAAGKVEDKSLFKILDRRAAIEKAVTLAGSKDLVLLTGKGSEPVMAVAHGKKIPWDDRVVVREILHKLGYADSPADPT